ncbi:MAG: heme exporter protein B [Cyclobacteriaceae bacterium]|jgi:heme exporter protein B
MNNVIHLLKKDFQLDFRLKYPFIGLILYLFSVVFLLYYSFSLGLKTEIWNSLLWITVLFVATNAIAKSFIQETNRNLYYYFISSPLAILTSKLIYSFCFLCTLCVISFGLFSILLGYPGNNQFWFWVNLLLGCLGISSAFTMISALSSKTNSAGVMMVILGFPVILPIIILGSSNSNILLLGGSITDISDNLMTLFSVDLVIIALAYILFPYSWRS